ncbi:MAG: Ig-like domain-containing protein [Betaproteobacteria bacterium]|nr:Ig-like domain-containing protein [Betaproteobacteria bacterium]
MMRLLSASLLALLSLGATAAAPHALWRLDAATESVKAASRNPGVHPITFEPQALTDWVVGESGDLALPGGRLYQIQADRVEEHSSGNRTWIGKFDVAGKTYVAVLTYGSAGMAGEVQTPDGPVLVTTEDSQVVLIDTAAAGWRLLEMVESDAMVQPPPAPVAGPAMADNRPVMLKSAPTPETTIDVLLVYTHGMVTRAGSTAAALLRLDQLIAIANQAYVASEVAITVRLVHALEVAYVEADDNGTALGNLTNGIGVMAPVQGTLRERYGADIVVLVRPFNYPGQVGCGIAWVGGYGGNGAAIGSQGHNGFAVVSDGNDVNGTGFYCQAATFPHELGHNMGAMHDRQTVTQGGTVALGVGAYPFSYGNVRNATWNAAQGQNVCNPGSGASCFGTIMSYLAKVSELKFSNPGLLTCPTGLACGTAIDDVALTLNNTRTGVAGWRTAKVPFVGVPTGSVQTAGINTPFVQPLKVTLRDATGQVVPGVTVDFSSPAAGASATLSAASVATDVNGVAQVYATANGSAGSYAVLATATSGRVAAPFAFSLVNSNAQALTLTVVINGGGTVTGTGINCPGACSATPPSGSSMALAASPGSGRVFTGWLGGGCTGVGACTVSIDAAKTVSATFAPSGTLPARIDVDLNGQYDALTDGVVILRYLFGMSGPALANGAIGAGASRADPTALKAFLDNIAPKLDVDGDGRADSLTDGLMVVRYLFGLRGTSLIQGAIGAGATRTTALQVESYIRTLLP